MPNILNTLLRGSLHMIKHVCTNRILRNGFNRFTALHSRNDNLIKREMIQNIAKHLNVLPAYEERHCRERLNAHRVCIERGFQAEESRSSALRRNSSVVDTEIRRGYLVLIWCKQDCPRTVCHTLLKDLKIHL